MAANDAAGAKADAWEDENPEPKSKRGRKHWIREAREYHYEVSEDAWLALVDAEKDFQAAQIAVAKVKPRDRANRSLRESRKNLALCKLKLFRSAGQDNHRISDCADFIIRILGGADGVVLHLRAGMLLS